LVTAVNLSPVQFRRGTVKTIVGTALQQSGLRPACLELEITESALIQDSEAFIVQPHDVDADVGDVGMTKLNGDTGQVQFVGTSRPTDEEEIRALRNAVRCLLEHGVGRKQVARTLRLTLWVSNVRHCEGPLVHNQHQEKPHDLQAPLARHSDLPWPDVLTRTGACDAGKILTGKQCRPA
jgi:hypothetical protein